jgi:Fe2+ transport system protein FeoA
MHTLATYQSSEPVLIKDLLGDDLIVTRLFEMGFMPGQKVTIQHRMAFGGPIIVFIQKTSVALRMEEASCIQIQE